MTKPEIVLMKAIYGPAIAQLMVHISSVYIVARRFNLDGGTVSLT